MYSAIQISEQSAVKQPSSYGKICVITSHYIHNNSRKCIFYRQLIEIKKKTRCPKQMKKAPKFIERVVVGLVQYRFGDKKQLITNNIDGKAMCMYIIVEMTNFGYRLCDLFQFYQQHIFVLSFFFSVKFSKLFVMEKRKENNSER